MAHDKTRAIGGICGENETLDYDEALSEVRSDYRWTPACQRAFLEELACTGSVMRAAKAVNKTPRGAYGFRHSREGAAFRLGWEAAVLVARCVVRDTLTDRALNGYEEVSHKDDDGTRWRGKFDNRLGQGLLTRLDRIVNEQPQAGTMAAQIQLVSQDWESFLELIGEGGTGAAAALFCAARAPEPAPGDEPGFYRELAQISADEEEVEEAEPSPEEQAGQLSVWWSEELDRWLTDFPPASAADVELVAEHGLFGEQGYTRTLTPAEDAAMELREAARIEPLRTAALAAHQAWFGVKDAA